MNINKVSLRMVKESTIKYEIEKIRSAKDIIDLINDFEDLENLSVENLLIICLDTKNKPINYSFIAKGNINECVVDIAELFKVIFLSNAKRFILIHNHPSGDTIASQQDLELTRKIKECSKLFNIDFLDHIIIGENRKYNSCFKEV